MENSYIYVIFSSTPNKIGGLIRQVTKEPYNHISISLDRELSRMYSFARRYYRTPLYGGFVRESRSRYFVRGKGTQICVCAIPVSLRQYLNISNLLFEMEKTPEQYLYNHISALGAVIHKSIYARDAYTCVEFCTKILREVGLELDSKTFHSVEDLHRLLADKTVYTGPMPEPDRFDSEFFARKPVKHPVITTVNGMLQLVPRMRK